MMEVLLQGDLGDRFGKKWKVAGSSYSDAISCIQANQPEFRKALIDIHEAGGDLSVQIGDRLIDSNEELINHIGKETIIITPIPTGSKSGAAKVIIGTLLIAAMFMFPVQAGFLGMTAEVASAVTSGIMLAGANLAIVGLQQMMAPDPSVDEQTRDYMFEGPENTVVANTPVPVLCGEMIIGGFVISSGTVGSTQTNNSNYIYTAGGDIDTWYNSAGDDLSIRNSQFLENLHLRAIGAPI